MKVQQYSFSYELYDRAEDLPPEDAALLQRARTVTKNAYAPYSNFHVGAAALLINGEIITGTNQENASFPAGICAERVLMSTAASLHPGVAIHSLAVSYDNKNGTSDAPISPCGICRQSLQEFEQRTLHPIRIILGGLSGPIYIIAQSHSLLPFAFTADELS